MSEEQVTQSNEIIRKHVLYTMGGSLIPIPIVDLAAVTAIQLDMMKQLANTYEVDFSESSGKSIVGALTGNILARLGASLFKAIPGVGSLLGGISLVMLTGAATYALGEVFLNHLEGGGSFLDFDAESYKLYYKEKYEEGKARAKAWKEEQDARKAGPAPEEPGPTSTGKTVEIDVEESLEEEKNDQPRDSGGEDEKPSEG